MSNEINNQEAWSRLIIDNFTKGKSLKEIVAYMVKAGWLEEAARNFANNIAQNMHEYQRGQKALSYRKRMIRGLIWTLAGIAITFATYLFTESGGQFIICWGAVLFGFIDFLVGFFGWISNR